MSMKRNNLKILEEVRARKKTKTVRVRNINKIPLGLRANLAKNYGLYLEEE